VASTPSRKKSRWDETPEQSSASAESTPTRRKSRWDETPVAAAPTGMGMPLGATPTMPMAMNFGATPAGPNAAGMFTPTAAQLASMTPEQVHHFRVAREIDERNRPMSDSELDAMLPPDGFKILDPPAGYMPVRHPSRLLNATPTPMAGSEGFEVQLEDRDKGKFGVTTLADDTLPALKPEDEQHFAKLMQDVDENELDADALNERRIMKLLLKIKNGTPPMRKSALRQITDKAREYGAGPLFNQILPLLMSPTLEDQERHLLVKVIDRVLYKLDDLVRPYVHKVLVVIEPLLIDEDYYARVEGREIISNLAKAAGLATMIATMRPDIDNIDEYVRNTTARAFAVVASALGIPALLPFLKAVCRSKKSWQARHTGIKICQQIAILMGCAILPHLRNLVSIIQVRVGDRCARANGLPSQVVAQPVWCVFLCVCAFLCVSVFLCVCGCGCGCVGNDSTA
jgi:splicing factor 3B subunit 1